MDKQKIQVVIVGAGYAGMMATLRLEGRLRDLNAEITLVNGSPNFVQRPRLHHVAVDQAVPETPIEEMLRGKRVNFVQGWVSWIDLEGSKVVVKSDYGTQMLDFDYLVYSLGSQVDQDMVPGIREHAYVLDPGGPNGAQVLREKLLAFEGERKRVVVVGGGATGIEVAAEVKGAYPRLEVSVLTEDRFGVFKGPRVEKHFRQSFEKQDIHVVEKKKVRAVNQGAVVLEDGSEVPADLTIWAGGFRATPLAKEVGFKVNQRGQIIVDPYGRALGHETVYAVGDASHPVEEPGNTVRMSLFTALIRGAHAADNLSALLKGKEQKALSFAYYGQGIAMGPRDAVGFLGYPSDNPVGPILRGRLAVQVRNFFVWMIFYFLVIERRFPGFFFWLGKGRYTKSLMQGQMREHVKQAP